MVSWLFWTLPVKYAESVRPTTILVEGVAEIGAGRTISCWLVVANPAAETVIVGVPGCVSWYWNVAEAAPWGIVTVEPVKRIAAGARGTGRPPEELARVKVTPPVPAAAGLPSRSSISMLIVAE